MTIGKTKWWVDGKKDYLIHLNPDDILFELPLPAMKKFRSNSSKEDHCPWFKFNAYVTKKLRKKKGIDVLDPNSSITSISQVVVSEKTLQELNQEVIRWIPKCRGYLQNGTKAFHSCYAFTSLNHQPCASDSPGIEDNVVYFRK